jgi:TM2 domain-containing membrane protein YozV
MNKILHIFFFLFSINCIQEAQSFDIQKLHADSLFQAESYFEAITEYKRLLYFSNFEEYKYESNYKMGLCYKAGGKYDNAIKYFMIAESYSENIDDSVSTEVQIIRTNILRKTIPEALALLNKLEKIFPRDIDSTTINYWSGWAYLIGDDWKKAAMEFGQIDESHPLKILSDSINAEKYSVTFAKISSFILPGSGQFYTGNYMSGVLSLGWNVLWGYLTINAFMTDRALEGILIGGLLWTRFYRGNFQNAEKFAVEKNIKISNGAYKYLENGYSGKKP